MRLLRPALSAFVLAVAASAPAAADPISVLFVGNSATFGRVDPVMSYNAANVRDLTAPMFAANPLGSNAYEPRPWGGVAGIFKQFTVQAGLDYDVAFSTRNAATLRGHLLNTNPAGWDLRGNIGSQTWGKVVLQEQTDEPLSRQAGLSSNPEYFRHYADKIENYVHSAAAQTVRDRDAFPGATAALRQAACVAAGIAAGTCSNARNVPANTKASAATEMYLYQTWARPDMVSGGIDTETDPVTGAVTRLGPATTFYDTLEAMTADLKTSYQAASDQADDDGSPGFKAIAPVGEAFMTAVQAGIATRDMWAPDAAIDGLIDLWFDDGLHASKWGSYLSALTLFGTLTGVDPASLGSDEIAARDLGIRGDQAMALQRVASYQLGFRASAVPEPSTLALVLAAVLAAPLGAARRRRA